MQVACQLLSLAGSLRKRKLLWLNSGKVVVLSQPLVE